MLLLNSGRFGSGASGITWIDTLYGEQSSTGTATTSVTTPTHIAGDLLVFFMFNSNNTRTISSGPSGATLKITETATTSGLRVWSKVAGGSEPGSFSVTLNSADNVILVCSVYRGGTDINVTYAPTINAGALTVTTGTFTPSAPGRLVTVWTTEGAGPYTINTPPTGPTQRMFFSATTRTATLYDMAQPASLTTAQTLTWNSGPNSRCALAFQVI